MAPVSSDAISLRPMLPADVPVLAAIFQASIEELATDDYDEAQRAAWAAAADDEGRFGAALAANVTLVAMLRGAPVGFVSLKGRDRIEQLYVYPRAARQGVAGALLDAVEKLAAGRGTPRLEVDASDVARPFFEARGFEALHRQTTMLGDVWFGNTRMRKILSKPPG